MNVKITFKRLESSPAVEEKIHEKSHKMKHYFNGKTSFQWICWKEDENDYWVEVKVVGPQFEFFAKAKHENLYKCFDLVSAKLEKQLEKKKEKLRNRVHNRDPIDDLYEAG